jgi:hypothetical protein
MPALDLLHDPVKNALIKDGWTITDDPYIIEYAKTRVLADLGAERTLAAERAGRKIVVEIKSFVGPSPMHDFEIALGQYQLYRGLLEVTAPERQLYLAISDEVYVNFFERKAIPFIIQRYHLTLLVVNVAAEEIVQWIN